MQPGLREKVLEVAHGVIRRSLQPTHNMVPWLHMAAQQSRSLLTVCFCRNLTAVCLLAKVSNLIRIEREFINAAHHNSVNHVQTYASAFRRKRRCERNAQH